jgi:hypothetical protein
MSSILLVRAKMAIFNPNSGRASDFAEAKRNNSISGLQGHPFVSEFPLSPRRHIERKRLMGWLASFARPSRIGHRLGFEELF